MQVFLYLLSGIIFGITLVKAEVISWFRIQEMFMLESFHMYGVIGSAIVVGAISYQLLRKAKAKSLDGKEIKASPKKFHKGVIIGGLMFGLGWAITGACPGPIYAQIGSGYPTIIITFLFAVLGTWLYGFLRKRLPH